MFTPVLGVDLPPQRALVLGTTEHPSSGGRTDQPALPPRASVGVRGGPEGNNLSFNLALSPLAMGPKQRGPPALCLT